MTENYVITFVVAVIFTMIVGFGFLLFTDMQYQAMMKCLDKHSKDVCVETLR